MNKELVARLAANFGQRYGTPDLITRSPGRINLIGEHTDYNLGFVLPAAIDKAVYIAIRKNTDTTIRMYAVDFDEEWTGNTEQLEAGRAGWPAYVLGVVQQLQKKNLSVPGFDAVIMGDVPAGAGLSSSAAMECASLFAFNNLLNAGMERLDIVRTAQKAENEFVGLQCGIMDMFASVFGKAQQLIRLDCRSLSYEYVPFDTANTDILLLDTGVKHSLASSAYNLRRQECEAGVAALQKKYPHIQSLRDADSHQVQEVLSTGDPVVYKRCRYVVEENERLLAACADLQRGDMAAFGRKMFETHEGLSNLYEVSCPEADALVETVRNHPAVIGARMMGGGFGGCTINLVKKGRTAEVTEAATAMYQSRFKRELRHFQVSIDDGTSTIQ
jgi:galactokinase